MIINGRKADKLGTDILRVQFTDSQMLDLGKDMARVAGEKRALESRKSEVVKRLAAEIAEKDTILGKLTDQVSQGYEYRDVETGTWFDYPRPGLATTFRLDLMESVSQRRMTESELQFALDLQPQKEAEAAVEAAAEEAAQEEAQEPGKVVFKAELDKRGAVASITVVEYATGYSYEVFGGQYGTELKMVTGAESFERNEGEVVDSACKALEHLAREQAAASEGKAKSAWAVILSWCIEVAEEESEEVKQPSEQVAE